MTPSSTSDAIAVDSSEAALWKPPERLPCLSASSVTLAAKTQTPQEMLPCHTCHALVPQPQSLTYFSGLYIFTDLHTFVLGLGYGPDVKTGVKTTTFLQM